MIGEPYSFQAKTVIFLKSCVLLQASDVNIIVDSSWFGYTICKFLQTERWLIVYLLSIISWFITTSFKGIFFKNEDHVDF